MDIPPPPPPPPSDDGPPPPPDSLPPLGPPPPPPYESGSPYGSGPPYSSGPPYGAGPPSDPNSPYGGGPPYPPGSAYAGPPPPYPQTPYGQQPPPYGAPGPYGYPYPYPQQPGQPGWHPQPPTNGLAIASLVTSLALCCLPVGLILGIFGLRQIRRRGERGKGLAVAGLTISSLGTLLMILLIVLASVGALDDDTTAVQDLKVGQCFNTTDQSLSDIGVGSETRSTSVDAVSCDDPHDAEVYAIAPLAAGPDGGYPGLDGATESTDGLCSQAAADFMDGSAAADDLTVYFYMPPEEAWDLGEKDVTCFFGDPSGRTSGSVRSGGSDSGGQGSGIGV